MTEKPEDSQLPPQIPEDMKKKFEEIKQKLDSYKKKVLAKLKDQIVGIELLPPPQPEEGEKIDPDDIHVLVLIDEIKDFKPGDFAKISETVEKSAEEIDKHIKAKAMSIPDLKEACYDAKYEILQMIGMGAIIYDKGMLAAVKVAEIHKTMVIKKFEKYIMSYIGVGSLFRGDANINDIDIAVIVDDTDVKRMSRLELKDRLRGIILQMGAEASAIAGIKDANFHIQTYILTDFWESVKDAHPVIFTMLRDGVPLYDRGVFMPWRLLLNMGRIKPSRESIDMQMEVGQYKIDQIKYKLLSVVGEDLFYAVMNPAQAALMLYGVAPPTPKETVKLMEEIFVKREKLLEQKYVDILEKIRKYFKDVEHRKMQEVTGKQIDELVNEAKEYLERIKKLFAQIEKKRNAQDMKEVYEACINVTRDCYATLNIEFNLATINKTFKKELCEKQGIPEKMLETLKEIINTKGSKISKPELEKVKREARVYLRSMAEFVQRKRGVEIEKARIRFKYGTKFGDAFLLNDCAYVVKDIDSKDKVVLKAKINKDGGLEDFKSSSMEELEKVMINIKVPEHVFIKEKIFEDLRSLFGEKVEVLVSY